MNFAGIDEREVDRVHELLKKEAADGGYRFNPDVEFTKNLVRGLLRNEQRYGYRACPCRLASGKRAEDLDIICPCDYRDADIDESGACYCALYVNESIANGAKLAAPVPERRPPRSRRGNRNTVRSVQTGSLPSLSLPSLSLPFPVWRCRVCGYLCAREHPPEACPICKASKDRFERFI
jgi:ferredoxin-thioredoxin reductase catalytic subunit